MAEVAANGQGLPSGASDPADADGDALIGAAVGGTKRPATEDALDDTLDAIAEPSAQVPSRGTAAGGRRGPLGIELLDLGGNGDCGWRSLYAASAQLKGKSPQEIKDSLDRAVRTLRVKVAAEMAKTRQQWEPFWACDPEVSEIMEDGPRPTTVDEFLLAVERPRRYVCPLVLRAAATFLNVDILAMRYDEKQTAEPWVTVGVFRARDRPTAHLLPILLRAGHFCTVLLPSGFKVPAEWRAAQVDRPSAHRFVLLRQGSGSFADRTQLRGRGGGPGVGPGAPPA